MTSTQRLTMGSGVGLLLASVGLYMIHVGNYGLTVFIVLPIAVGAFGAWVTRAKTESKAIVAGMAANVIALMGFLAAGLEGLLCIAMALPLALPFGAFGGWL